MNDTQQKQQEIIRYMANRIATLISTSTVMNDNGVQVMVIASKGVWNSLAELVTDENGMVEAGPNATVRLPAQVVVGGDGDEVEHQSSKPVQLELPFGDWEDIGAHDKYAGQAAHEVAGWRPDDK